MITLVLTAILYLSSVSFWTLHPYLDSLFQNTPVEPVRDASISDPDTTVILGAGVIGLSTAYHLATSLSGNSSALPSRYRILVIEPSHDICPAASGGATGGLGDFGFSETVAPLGNLSYHLHQELASAYDGSRNWGFADQRIYRVISQNFSGDPFPSDSWGYAPPVAKAPSALPSWIKSSDDWSVQLLARAPHDSHIEPARLCRFLYEKSLELGVQFRFNSVARSVQQARDTEEFDQIEIQTQRPRVTTEAVKSKALVIAAGPWSEEVFSSLFPRALVKLHMNTTWAAGNHVRVRSSRWEISNLHSAQVFLNTAELGSKTIDITSYSDNSLYLAGWGAIPSPLPKEAEDVQPQLEEIKHMIGFARHYLSLEQDDELEVFDLGRCYRPQASPDRPIITRVSWSALGGQSISGKASANYISPSGPETVLKGGLYINTGHNSNGVTLAPGSGKVMSELLLGQTPSVPISDFDL